MSPTSCLTVIASLIISVEITNDKKNTGLKPWSSSNANVMLPIKAECELGIPPFLNPEVMQNFFRFIESSIVFIKQEIIHAVKTLQK